MFPFFSSHDLCLFCLQKFRLLPSVFPALSTLRHSIDSVLQCVLTAVLQPHASSSSCVWSRDAFNCFRELVDDSTMRASLILHPTVTEFVAQVYILFISVFVIPPWSSHHLTLITSNLISTRVYPTGPTTSDCKC